MTATIHQLRPKQPVPPKVDLVSLRDKVCEENQFLLGSDYSCAQDNITLFVHARFPGEIMANVLVRPNGVIQGLYRVEPETGALHFVDPERFPLV